MPRRLGRVGTGIGSTSAMSMLNRAKMSGAEQRAKEAWEKYKQDVKIWESDFADYEKPSNYANLAGNVLSMAAMAAIPGLGMAKAGGDLANVAGTTALNFGKGYAQEKGGNFLGGLINQILGNEAPTPLPEFASGEDWGYWGRRAIDPYKLKAAGDPEAASSALRGVESGNEEMSRMLALANLYKKGGGEDWLYELLGWG